jgi:hypothetical protein
MGLRFIQASSNGQEKSVEEVAAAVDPEEIERAGREEVRS